MRKILILSAVCLTMAACAGRSGVGVDYYDGYYDGYYGTFSDGYWGNDGYFWYSDANRGWHRDDGRHFQRRAGSSGRWDHVRGSGLHRDH
jgi:hypothetical protein